MTGFSEGSFVSEGFSWEAEKNSTVRSLYPGKLPSKPFSDEIQKETSARHTCPWIKHMAQLPKARALRSQLPGRLFPGRYQCQEENLEGISTAKPSPDGGDALDDLPAASLHFPGEAGAENGIHIVYLPTGRLYTILPSSSKTQKVFFHIISNPFKIVK